MSSFIKDLSRNINRIFIYLAFRYQMHKKSMRDHDQIVPSIGPSLNDSPRSDLDFGIERYSRKVFVGGLPPDIDEGIYVFISMPHRRILVF